jgi:RNA polymerase sigma factor (sigma-70 family)
VSVAEDNEIRLEQYLRSSFAALVARLRRSFSERVSPEDLAQEALIRAWQLEARGEHIHSLEPWMTAAATNLARSRWRTIHVEDRTVGQLAKELANDPAEVSRTPADGSLLSPLEAAIGALSLRQGQIVFLHYYGDLSVAAIASRLDVSEGTVKRTLHDARAALRPLVGQEQHRQADRRHTMTGWRMAGSQPSQYEHALVDDVTHAGKAVVALRCVVAKADGFGTLMQTFAAEHYLGQRVRFSGAIKCSDVNDRAGLWMRVDGPAGSRPLAFDNMWDRRISGTTEWQHHDVVLDVPVEAEAIALGVLLVGKGEVWMSDFDVDTVDLNFETTGASPALPSRPSNLDFSEPLAAHDTGAGRS